MANIRVRCPTCNAELEIDERYDGQEVECGSCLQVFVAKGPGSTRGAARELRGRHEEDEEERRPARRRSRRPVEDDYDDYDYAPPRRGEGGTGLAVTSLILGIVSLPMACCCGLFSLPVSIGAAVTGGIAMKNPEGKGMAVTGLVLGVLGIVLTVLALVVGLGFNLANMNKVGR